MYSVSAQGLSQDLETLEALVLDNPDLEGLEALLVEFNNFEAIGAVSVELRRSDFLAFLLNPAQYQGLGEAFAKRYCKNLGLLRPEIPRRLPPFIWTYGILMKSRTNDQSAEMQRLFTSPIRAHSQATLRNLRPCPSQ
jgi:hypothetical protein